jgi:hypothetical protein
LKSPEEFPALITHNDITPSLLSLLKTYLSFTLPETVHYISDGLNTSNTFETKSKMLFLKYSRRIDDFLYNEYIYHNTGEVYRLNENLDMIPEASSTIKLNYPIHFPSINTINHYVYNNNRLIKTLFIRKKKLIY